MEKEHFEELLKYSHEYQRRNRDKVLMWKKNYYYSNLISCREARKKYNKKWRLEHPKEAKRRDREWYDQNRDKKLAYMKEYGKRRRYNAHTLLVIETAPSL